MKYLEKHGIECLAQDRQNLKKLIADVDFHIQEGNNGLTSNIVYIGNKLETKLVQLNERIDMIDEKLNQIIASQQIKKVSLRAYKGKEVCYCGVEDYFKEKDRFDLEDSYIVLVDDNYMIYKGKVIGIVRDDGTILMKPRQDIAEIYPQYRAEQTKKKMDELSQWASDNKVEFAEQKKTADVMDMLREYLMREKKNG